MAPGLQRKVRGSRRVVEAVSALVPAGGSRNMPQGADS
jgi:hypothetical protein